MKKRDILNTRHLEESRKRKRKSRIQKYLAFLLVLFLIFIGLGFLSQISKLQIVEVEVYGSSVASREELISVVEAELSSRYLWLFPKTNVLLYPKNKIKEELESQFKILKEINIEASNSRHLKISVSERMPTFTWCGEYLPSMEEEAESQCYFSDETGFIFAEAPYFSSDVYLKLFGEIKKNNQEVLGGIFMSDKFEDAAYLLKTFEAIGLQPIALHFTKDKIEIYLNSTTSLEGSPKIVLKPDFELTKIAENMQTILTTEPFQSEFKNKYASLEYVDLSFGNKVYYRFKQ